jgi:hypothetical protein
VQQPGPTSASASFTPSIASSRTQTRCLVIIHRHSMLVSLMFTKLILAVKPLDSVPITAIEKAMELGPGMFPLVTNEVALALEGILTVTLGFRTQERVGDKPSRCSDGVVVGGNARWVVPVPIKGH